MSTGREGIVARWGPQVVGWIVAALLGIAVMQTRVAVLERVNQEHERRLIAIEVEQAAARRVLVRLETLLDRLEDQQRREGR